jgi:hypothetical protein
MGLWPGHGVAAGLVVDEVTASGFALAKMIDDWPGRGPLESYCAVFRKTLAAAHSAVPFTRIVLRTDAFFR